MAITSKTVLITGCSENGIGAALATEYQKRGYHVFASARNTKKIPSSLASASNVTLLPLDVTSEESIKNAASAVSKATGGKLDILINNSGAAFSGPALDTDLSIARNLLEVNVVGVLAVCQGFQHLLASTKGATLVNNSSINGDCNMPFSGVYGATKAATTILSESMRLELTPLDIRTVTLITGIIESNLHVNEVEHHLPANSYYKVTEDWLNERKKGTNRPPGMAAADYAKQFVDKVERGASGKTNIGHITPMFVYVKWWLPQFLWDFVMYKAGPPNLMEVAGAVKNKSQ
ncbi:Short-chain dehydrogenase ptmH [Fulvia fulva]|nr:Short-chain dehydrogenase ptmH [Fulvia fulva]KAK4622633.1 Short-chain dehydrogenase ptmH [Fulvia fulva]WPV16461.1 Short-chain dehydrogenase ptmH [Fulvia fulva]WPV30611.1 Short-chain dehydrogenase ptmH [Fulvia fulva]